MIVRTGAIGVLAVASIIGATTLATPGVQATTGTWSGADGTATVLRCDHVIGTARTSAPGLVAVPPAKPAPADPNSAEWTGLTTVASGHSPKKYTAPCTGAFTHGATGQPDVGDLKSWALKFTGRESCSTSLKYGGVNKDQYPFSGTVGMTFTNIDPITNRNYRASAHVVLGPAVDHIDEFTMYGVVYSGVAKGALLTAHWLFQPTKTNDNSNAAALIGGGSVLDPAHGTLVPGDPSTLASFVCLNGGPGIREWIVATNGPSLLGGFENSAVTFALPTASSSSAYIPFVPENRTTVLTCDHVGGYATFSSNIYDVAAARNVVEPWLPASIGAAFADNTTSPCTGNYPIANDDYAAIVGDLVGLTGTLHGRPNCDPFSPYTIDPDQYPLTGVLTGRFANNDALGKPYKFKADVVIGPATPTPGVNSLLDEVTLTGVVSSGVAKGAIVSAKMLMQSAGVPGLSTWTGGYVVPGIGALTNLLNCNNLGYAVSKIVLGTDGTGLLGPTEDSELTFDLPSCGATACS